MSGLRSAAVPHQIQYGTVQYRPADTLTFPSKGGNFWLARCLPHLQSYIKVVDPRVLPFLLFNHNPFRSSTLSSDGVFALLPFETLVCDRGVLSLSSAFLLRSTASLPVRDSIVSTTSENPPQHQISSLDDYINFNPSIKPLQLSAAQSDQPT